MRRRLRSVSLRPFLSRPLAGFRLRSAAIGFACLIALGCDSTAGPSKAIILSVSEPPNGAGVVRSLPLGISCPGDCSHGFKKGQEVHLTGIPSAGWRMVGWAGATTLATDTCTVIMAGPRLVTAVFMQAPQVPSDLAAEGVSRSRINLTWKDESVSETEFRLEQALGPQGPWDEVAVLPANTTQYSHIGLIPYTYHHYRLRACNGPSCSDYSATAVARTFPFLFAPSGLVAEAVSYSWIHVTWEVRQSWDGGAPGGMYFELERSSEETHGWVQVAQLPLGNTFYFDADLLPGSTWYYRVRICGERSCSPYSETDSATLPVQFQPPSLLKATPVTQARVDLTWMDNASFETSHEVERRLDRSFEWGKLTELDPDASSFSDTTVVPGETYFYRVRTCDESSCTEYSNTDSATTGPGLSVVRGGWLSTCGVSVAGKSYCWGYQAEGRLGNGSTDHSATGWPVSVSSGLTFAAMASGTDHTCGLTAAGEAHCWGKGDQGQLGNGALTHQSEPIPVSGSLTFRSIGAGHGHSCGPADSGETYCWGAGSAGQLGNGHKADAAIPIPVSGAHSFVLVDAGYAHSCGLTASGEAYCWGGGENGELGDGSRADQATPVPVAGGLTFQALTLGAYHSCGLTPSGEAYCWGRGEKGQLGDGLRTNQATPVPVAGGLTFKAVTLGAYHSCGLTPAGEAYCWGRGEMGQLGDGSRTDMPVPEPVAGELSFESLSAGGFHTCGLISLGRAYCWGWNTSGQGGQGSDQENAATPVPILWR